MEASSRRSKFVFGGVIVLAAAFVVALRVSGSGKPKADEQAAVAAVAPRLVPAPPPPVDPAAAPDPAAAAEPVAAADPAAVAVAPAAIDPAAAPAAAAPVAAAAALEPSAVAAPAPAAPAPVVEAVAAAPVAAAPVAAAPAPAAPSAPIAAAPARAIASSPSALAAALSAAPLSPTAAAPKPVIQQPSPAPAPIAAKPVPVTPTRPTVAMAAATVQAPAAAATAADESGPYGLAMSQCRAYLTAGQIRNAVSACRQATEARPGSPEALVLLAEAEFTRGHTGLALRLATEATVTDQNFADAYVVIGGIYQDKGKSAEARAAYEQYLALQPKGKHAADLRAILSAL